MKTVNCLGAERPVLESPYAGISVQQYLENLAETDEAETDEEAFLKAFSREMLEALLNLRSAGWRHGDIFFTNVCINENFVPGSLDDSRALDLKLIDFSNAQLIESESVERQKAMREQQEKSITMVGQYVNGEQLKFPNGEHLSEDDPESLLLRLFFNKDW